MNINTINTVGIIGGLVVGVAALVLQFKQLNKKSFIYDISDTPIISFNEKIGDVAVIYKSRPVENLRVVMVRVWNSGNLPIRVEDFSVFVSFCQEQTARGNSLVVAQVVEEPDTRICHCHSFPLTLSGIGMERECCRTGVFTQS